MAVQEENEGQNQAGGGRKGALLSPESRVSPTPSFPTSMPFLLPLLLPGMPFQPLLQDAPSERPHLYPKQMEGPPQP